MNGAAAPTFLQMAVKRAARNRRRLPRFPAARPPLGIEREYLRDLIPYLKSINAAVETQFISRLPDIVRQYDMNRPGGARRDAGPEDIANALANARIIVDQAFTPEQIRRIAQIKGISVSQWNKEVLNRGLRRVIGFDVFYSQPYLANELALFTSQNVNLITSVAEQSFQKIETLAYQGLQSGRRWEDIAKDVRGLVDPEIGNTRARAELIARDQVNKLNGQLNFLRQTELGVTRYTWRTVGDDRVRHSHAIKDGQTYEWNNPPADTGHPGEDYQCRCWAEPDLAGMIEGLE